MIGDLALCGFDLAGHLVAYRSGHALNVALAGELLGRATGTAVPLTDPVTVPLTAPVPRRRAA